MELDVFSWLEVRSTNYDERSRPYPAKKISIKNHAAGSNSFLWHEKNKPSTYEKGCRPPVGISVNETPISIQDFDRISFDSPEFVPLVKDK